MDTETKSSSFEADSPPPETSDQVIRFKRGHLYAAFLPLAFVVGLASGYLFWGRKSVPRGPVAQVVRDTVVATPKQQQPVRLEVSEDDDPALGPEDAEIVIIEFSDFNCPYCQRFHQETFTALMDTYEGQIRFVYRDFPIVGGGQVGAQAAQAANCAAEQGDYWAYHDALFSGRYGLDRNDLNQYAVELELDQTVFEECLDSGRFEDEVRADFQEGADLGVSGTPTFFINGIPLVGAQPLDSFTLVIDDELAR